MADEAVRNATVPAGLRDLVELAAVAGVDPEHPPLIDLERRDNDDLVESLAPVPASPRDDGRIVRGGDSLLLSVRQGADVKAVRRGHVWNIPPARRSSAGGRKYESGVRSGHERVRSSAAGLSLQCHWLRAVLCRATP